MEFVEEDLVEPIVETENQPEKEFGYSSLFRFTYLIYSITFSFLLCFLLRFYHYISNVYTKSINFIVPLLVFITISYTLLLFSVRKEQKDNLSGRHKLVLGAQLSIFTAFLHAIYSGVFFQMKISTILSNSVLLAICFFLGSLLILVCLKFITKMRALL